MSHPALILKSGREKSLFRRHPWVFSGAIGKVHDAPGAGETVAVRAADGTFLAWAAYSPKSQIRARVWSWDENDTIDEAFLFDRLRRSIAARQPFFGKAEPLSAVRLVYGESDSLPGLIIDRYADTLVMQCLSAGIEPWREKLAGLALKLTGAVRVYERSEADVRQLEGMGPRCGPLSGTAPPERIVIEEGGLRFGVDVRQGHKTGFYLDQRSNRRRIWDLADGREVLDCFTYSGGFALSALGGGASSVTAVDASAGALTLAGENLALNPLPAGRIELVEGDVFQMLRRFRNSGRSFDMIILDPPKFAQTASQAERAARGYKDINLLACKLLRPGGLLATFSCSGGVSADLFQKIIAGAALDARIAAQIAGYFQQDADHPVALNFPQGAYLKGLLVHRT